MSDCEAKVGIKLVPSATLDFANLGASLKDGEYVGVWVADTNATLSAFIPSVPGETSIQVPADITLIPLLIANKLPRRVGLPIVLKPGETTQVSFAGRSGAGDVVVWFDLDTAASAESDTKPTKPPTVNLRTASGLTLQPVNTLRHPQALGGSLLFFKDVPAGPVSVSVAGDYWTKDAVALQVAAEAVAMAPRGLLSRPAGAMNVSFPSWLVHRATAVSEGCSKETQAVSLEVLRCDPSTAPASDSCKVAISQELADLATRPIIRIDGLTPGDYTIRMQPSQLGGSARVKVTPLEDAMVVPEFAGTIVTGTVRKGGAPVRAELNFATDDAATTDDAGRYYALLRADPGSLPVTLLLCDGHADVVYMPDEAPRADRPFDIELPDNALRVVVHDAATGVAIPNAKVIYAPAPAADGGSPFSLAALTDTAGDARFHSVPAKMQAVICASAATYERRCSDPFMMKASGEDTRHITLAAAQRHGRVTAPGPLTPGRIFLTDTSGHLFLSASFDEDGIFGYDSLPSQASAVIVSSALPLTVIPTLFPAPNGDDLVISLAVTPSRGFSIALAPDSKRHGARVGLSIDGVNIPMPAFTLHQSLRGQQAVVLPHRPLIVEDVVATGSITVRLGQDPDDLSVPVDAVSRPEYFATFPAKNLAAGERELVFP